MEKLTVLVIEGTNRQDRKSIHVANLITEVGDSLENVEAILVDPNDFEMTHDGNDAVNKHPKYTELTAKADAFFLVVPEYNHSFPASLKRVLDNQLKNYNHKPANLAGVSSGPWGGTRAIQSILPAVRELGLVATHTDVHFPFVQKLFDEQGKLQDEKYRERVEKAYTELLWFAEILKKGRAEK